MFERDEKGAARLGGVLLSQLFDVADPAAHPTPAYVYDVDAMVDELRDLQSGFGETPHLVCYAVKANSAGPILRAFAKRGAGADVVSGAELALSLGAGIAPERIVFSGVAKRDAELDLALGAGGKGILAIQAESVEEIPRIDARARAGGVRARVSLRINPGIEAETHAHIATGHDEAKFGIPKLDLESAIDALRTASSTECVGVSSHVGSQLTSTDSYLAAARMLVGFAGVVESALERPLSFVDFGGGFGIDYGTGCPVRPRDFARELARIVHASGRGDRLTICEPGRSLVASHGVLVASVIMEKCARPSIARREWLMIDAGMNDLLRPALYQAIHRIEPLETAPPKEAEGRSMRVVGPVCESSDDFGNYRMPIEPIARVVIRDVGAYGFTMASEYNGRALPREIFLASSAVSATICPRSTSAWIAERLGFDPDASGKQQQ